MSKLRDFTEWSIAILVLSTLLAYTYIHLFATPFLGFHFHSETGQITEVLDASNTADRLQEGDQIQRIDDLSWAEFRNNPRQPFLEGYQADQIVPLIISRDGNEIEIAWHLPLEHRAEFIDRLLNIWWLSYILWTAGVLTILLIRPNDIRRYLLIAFYFLTALWIMLGAISTQHVAYSAVFFCVFLWLSVPVYLHLHWVFPQPLKPLPVYVWLLLYFVGVGLAAAEWLQLLPRSAYYIGLLIAISGSLILMFLHYRAQPENRREIRILGAILLIALLPTAVIIVITLAFQAPESGSLVLLTLAGVPIAYFYSSYRRQAGWLELRANRFVALFFFIMLLTLLDVVALMATTAIGRFDLLITVSIMMTLATILVTVYGFPHFRRMIESRILGMPLPPAHLLADYTTSIATSMDRQSLVQLLKQKIVSTLLIRQSALLHLKLQDHEYDTIYVHGITETELPTAAQIPELLYLAEQPFSTQSNPRGWIRLIIPIRLEEKVIALWCLGQRDPDDIYTRADIETLHSLAAQTAIALTNIVQSEQLRNLYETNIVRQEYERAQLARFLHDSILNQLAVLSDLGSRVQQVSGFQQTYEKVANDIRMAITGLRPNLLIYGLGAALDELVDHYEQRATAEMNFLLEISPTPIRYPTEAEQHLFRVVQQALENALNHSQAQTVRIEGWLEASEVHLSIEDDGKGMEGNPLDNLAHLVEEKHYGLVNMFERCQLIKADLQIETRLGRGTAVKIIWRPQEATAE